MPAYGYLGPEGTFSEAALRSLPVAFDAELISFPSVPDALDAVRAQEVDGALVPLENSVEGSVSSTLDELATGTPVVIDCEVLLPVSLALLARGGTSLADIRTVTTIGHAEAQVRRWLRANVPGFSFIPAASTADGAHAVAEGHADAAVAAPLAAERYGLSVVAADINDNPDAVTRFVLVTRPSPPHRSTGADRTTVVAYIADDHPGALLEILTEFAVRGVNLTRIESRPTGGGLGRYYFSIDCEGHITDERVGEALSALRRICADVRFVGSYARSDQAQPVVRRGTDDKDFQEAAEWLARIRAGEQS